MQQQQQKQQRSGHGFIDRHTDAPANRFELVATDLRPV